eukprot:gnl/MRDRNA2_/MRDRNA2_195223_c0_seq1.p1 gnl/MRDRNA2_/MRDRNA2_195223_c0~~gnl/MRDRNA2_/MRDRNA2_195223_c0_seq1.p1  ORF type:complete len:187 (-),score=48.96 gnl/MRDRNA2_/MRDRNA2_195223_c0_seq1:52-612(-)
MEIPAEVQAMRKNIKQLTDWIKEDDWDKFLESYTLENLKEILQAVRRETEEIKQEAAKPPILHEALQEMLSAYKTKASSTSQQVYQQAYDRINSEKNSDLVFSTVLQVIDDAAKKPKTECPTDGETQWKKLWKWILGYEGTSALQISEPGDTEDKGGLIKAKDLCVSWAFVAILTATITVVMLEPK